MKLNLTPRPLTICLSKFMSLIDKQGPNGCWNWTGPTCKGYGLFPFPFGYGHGKAFRAHRFSYLVHVGPIPPNMTIDHLCFNKACVNPTHLEAVPLKVNIQRSWAARPRKTHCKRGHQLSGNNLVLIKSRGTYRCRQCSRINYLESVQRHKQ